MRNQIPDTSVIIKSMMEEIHRLSEEQVQVLKRATFVGMTSNEAIECDSRRCRIRTLAGKLERLQNAKNPANE